jgi:hypothetical protein
MPGSRRVRLIVLFLVACHQAAPAPGTPEDLAAYLGKLAGADDATRAHELAGWILDDATWRATVVPTYAPLWTDYAQGFDTALAPLAAQLAKAGKVSARRHYAGDPRLTLSQARLRWAVPVQYPSAVAELSGAPIDTVFVYDGARWRVLAGTDELVLARVRALDAGCASLVARAGAANNCTAVAWQVVDSALRADHAGFAHACGLAANLCANSPP